MAFWIITALIALVTFLVLAAALLRGHAHSEGPSDVEIYRDQLRDLERDVARGTLDAGEAERARIEISRRLLEADRRAQATHGDTTAPRWATLSAALLAALLIIGGGFWFYHGLGANRIGQIYPDMGLKARKEAAEELRRTRPSQDEAEADLAPWPGPGPEFDQEYLDMIVKLRTAMEQRPDELEGQLLLVTHEAQLGNFVAARKAMQAAIALKGDAADDDDYARLADLLVLAADGYVSPQAEQALNAALARNERNPVAMFYTGLLDAQIGRPDKAFTIWRTLLEQSPADAPWMPPVRQQIGQLAALAGVDYTPPAPVALPGPSAADMANAADMSDEERQQMIEGMVTRLSERLATEGGNASEWARLIGALGVLGQKDRAAAIWGEAQTVFGPYPEELAVIRDAAREAGVADVAPAGDLRGPSAAEMEAAAQMSDEERAGMIRDMVEQLSARLASEGGSAPEWAQLIGALGVLGESERAKAIWDEAQSTFAGRPGELAVIREAAQNAGLGTETAPVADEAEQARLRALDNEATMLADRLANGDGTTAQDWARLIEIYGEMGESALATRVWERAQGEFSELSAGMAEIRAAAVAAGIAE